MTEPPVEPAAGVEQPTTATPDAIDPATAEGFFSLSTIFFLLLRLVFTVAVGNNTVASVGVIGVFTVPTGVAALGVSTAFSFLTPLGGFIGSFAWCLQQAAWELFVGVLLGTAIPWVLAAVQALRRVRNRDEGTRGPPVRRKIL
ncbi:unnamed protein product [Amoebophrya sp. A25]|nr:unnamed protein product [Amoebophrya sp. A25]|eukprot:GSA25T00025300001.1